MATGASANKLGQVTHSRIGTTPQYHISVVTSQAVALPSIGAVSRPNLETPELLVYDDHEALGFPLHCIAHSYVIGVESPNVRMHVTMHQHDDVVHIHLLSEDDCCMPY